MTDTSVSDAVVFPQDDGTGVTDDSEDFNSAAYFGLIARNVNGEYVANGLGFANIDTTNEQVDITAGHAFITDPGNQVQSGSQRTYDTSLPGGSDMVYAVVLPTNVVDLNLDTDATNEIWLAVDPASNDGVYLRHGSGLNAPGDPSVKLGTVNTSDGSTTRPNEGPVFKGPSVEVDEITGGVTPSPITDLVGPHLYINSGSLAVVDDWINDTGDTMLGDLSFDVGADITGEVDSGSGTTDDVIWGATVQDVAGTVDNIRWERDAGATIAFRVYNAGTGTALADVTDSGDLDLTGGAGYVAFQGYGGGTYYLGNAPDTEVAGIKIETGTNPASGDPIFIIESSGGSERLRVEHDGVTSTSNMLDSDGGGFRLERRTADPTSPAAGRMWYRSDLD